VTLKRLSSAGLRIVRAASGLVKLGERVGSRRPPTIAVLEYSGTGALQAWHAFGLGPDGALNYGDSLLNPQLNPVPDRRTLDRKSAISCPARRRVWYCFSETAISRLARVSGSDERPGLRRSSEGDDSEMAPQTFGIAQNRLGETRRPDPAQASLKAKLDFRAVPSRRRQRASKDPPVRAWASNFGPSHERKRVARSAFKPLESPARVKLVRAARPVAELGCPPLKACSRGSAYQKERTSR
jgi:hypothetical protein